MNLNRTSLVVNKTEQWLFPADNTLLSGGDVVKAPLSPPLPIIKRIALDAKMKAVRVDYCGGFIGINEDGTTIIKFEPDGNVTDIYTVTDNNIIQFSVSPFYICFIDDYGVVYIFRYDSAISEVKSLHKMNVGNVIGLATGLRELFVLCEEGVNGDAEIRIFDCLSGSETAKVKVGIKYPDSIYYDEDKHQLILTSKNNNTIELLYPYAPAKNMTREINLPINNYDSRTSRILPDPRGGFLAVFDSTTLVHFAYDDDDSFDYCEINEGYLDISLGPNEDEIIVLTGDGGYLDIHKVKPGYKTGAVSTEYIAVKPGYLDSSAKRTDWHKLTLDAKIPDDTKITVYYFASDDIENWLTADYLTNLSEIEVKKKWSTGIINPRSLLFDAKDGWTDDNKYLEGQYLYLLLKLEWTSDATPEIRSLTVEFPRNTYLAFLPTVYHEDPQSVRFLDGLLSIFEDIAGRLEKKTYLSDLLINPALLDSDYLRWLAVWLGICAEPGWKDDEIRRFIDIAPTYYKRRGTKEGLQMILNIFMDTREDDADIIEISDKLYTYGYRYGTLPKIVEAFEAVGLIHYIEDEELRSTFLGLFASTEFAFTVLLPGYAGFDFELRDKIAKVLLNEKPAHTRACISYLWPAYLLDGHTYLGVNTIYTEPHYLMGDWWLSFDSVIGGPPPIDKIKEDIER